MCLPSLRQWRAVLFGLALTWLCSGGQAADPPAADPSPASATVGRLSQASSLVLEGNQKFSKEKILEGLAMHLDYHVAAHRLAPRRAFLVMLEEKVVAGYRRAGFPDATAKASVNEQAGQVVLRIVEGARFQCGEVILSGLASMTNQTIRQKIVDRLSGVEVAGQRWDQPFWSPGKPAAFGDQSQQSIHRTVLEALVDLNYYQPTCTVRLVPDPARGLADLQIAITDEGIKGNIVEFKVNGLRKNTPAQVLEFLKLQEGMAMRANLAQSVSNQLRQTGRFLHHEVVVRPQTEVGKFKVELELEEHPQASPLSQPPSPAEDAMLKFGAWLQNLDRHVEDLAMELEFRRSAMPLKLEAALSASGIAVVARSTSNTTPALRYAITASEHTLGFFAPWRGRKYVVNDFNLAFRILAKVEPNPDNAAKFHAFLSVGFGNKQSGSSGAPGLDMDLCPAAFLDMVHRKTTQFSIENGIPTFRFEDQETHEKELLQIDRGTGRLIRMTLQSDDGIVLIQGEEGAYARLVQQIAAATAEHPNDYQPEENVASSLNFVLTDLMQSSLLDRILREALQDKERPEDAEKHVQVVLRTMAKARMLLGRSGVTEVLQPLGRLFPGDKEDQEAFSIPFSDALTGSGSNPAMALVASWVVSRADAMFPSGSWPWVLVRETTFTVLGQSSYTKAELDALRKPDAMGPLGCLTTASLVGRLDPQLARAFAESGLERLSPADFRRDYGVLLESDAVVPQIMANAIGLLRPLSEKQIRELADELPAHLGLALVALGQSIRGAPNQPVGTSAWSVVEPLWPVALRAALEGRLRHFLPQAQILTDPRALYERGMSLMDPNGTMKDPHEAAECFTKAANLGHPGAQLQLGFLYATGQGVPEDFAQAMAWLQKAHAQKQPHAACRIASLYRDGKGVDQDLKEAARWYQIEADGDCALAQANLGRILESQNQHEAAIKYMRRAAENGEVATQAHLAEVFSEGLMVPRDYVEACQWQILVARNPRNRLAQADLRRLKAKLNAEQIEEAQRRADTVLDRLEEMAKKK